MQTARLGDICEFKPKKSLSKVALADSAQVSFGPMEQLSIGKKYFTPIEQRDLSSVYSSYVYFQDGDVIYAKITPCFENGKMGIAKNLINGVGFGSSEFVPIRCSEKILPEYLYYFLLSPSFIKNGAPIMRGASGHKRVPDDYTKDLLIPLPPLEAQQKKVVELDTAFEKTAQAIKLVKENLRNSQKLFENSLNNMFASQDWKPKKLSDLAEYFNGLTYKPGDVSDEGVVVLRSSNIQNDGLDFADIVRVTSSIKEKILVQDGDILMCSRNGSKKLLGKTATITGLTEPMTFGTFMMIVRGHHNSFLIWFFKTKIFRDQLSRGENTSINQITRYMLDEVTVPFPPVKDYERAINELSDLFAQTRKLQKLYLKKLDSLVRLQQSILIQAFSESTVE